MKPIAKARRQMQLSSKQLRRARRLYFFLCRHAWKEDPNGAMKRMEDTSRAHGLYYHHKCWSLYAKQGEREWRYRCCRYMWKILGGKEYQDQFGWGRWKYQNGFDSNFVYHPELKEARRGQR